MPMGRFTERVAAYGRALGGWVRRPTDGRWWLFIGTGLLLLLILAVKSPTGFDLRVGQVASRDIQAPRPVVNRVATEQLREQAAREAVRNAADDPANYRINATVAIQASDAVQDLYARLADFLPSQETPAGQDQDAAPNAAPAQPTETQVVEAVRLLAEAGVPLPASTVRAVLQGGPRELERLAQVSRETVEQVLRTRRVPTEELEAVRGQVGEFLPDQGLSEAQRRLVGLVVAANLRPNLILDPQAVQRVESQARRSVPEVMVQQGQMIVRRGDVATAETVQILQDLGVLRPDRPYRSWAGLALAAFGLVALLGIAIHQFRPALSRDVKQLGLLSLVVGLVATLARIGSVVGWEGAPYLIPVALGSMLVTILVDSQVAVLTTLVTALLTGIMTGFSLEPAVVAVTSGLTAVFSVSRASQRSDVTRAGFLVGAAALVTILALGLARGTSALVPLAWVGLVNGLISSVGTLGLLPYLETAFSITSSIRLLELANPNQPLLRRLLMEAPGTYHHSIMVGNLAEAAAEATGGDSLLVRVGALYHDIGKIRRPYFFVENQFSGENPHDKIAPSLSTLIIVSHVRDGLELAREYGLPPMVVDFIAQHHGTDLVRYFYNKALENNRGGTVEEKDFRYPGPKPQTRETAILMLADGVEATVRSLNRPTPGRIEGVVRRSIKGRLESGQLDSSELTLKDLDKIAGAFVKVLNGVYHTRVEYPERLVKEMQARRA
ncbi:phosphohydrolase [Limnochorda pilosa]|uniref:Phosphohydrolase n=1 Tax=Limnochorda pilosa TaxID=1555112 RepID=A0A0K2SMY3_LIMPI|nr:phosphohydrolase [Limnochorda pilosa]